MKNVSLLLLGVCLLAACGKSRIPDGYYVNKDATGISCVVFQIKVWNLLTVIMNIQPECSTK